MRSSSFLLCVPAAPRLPPSAAASLTDGLFPQTRHLYGDDDVDKSWRGTGTGTRATQSRESTIRIQESGITNQPPGRMILHGTTPRHAPCPSHRPICPSNARASGHARTHVRRLSHGMRACQAETGPAARTEAAGSLCGAPRDLLTVYWTRDSAVTYHMGAHGTRGMQSSPMKRWHTGPGRGMSTSRIQA